MVSRRTAGACSMRRSDQPSRPSARICCCLVSSKTLLMPATELAFLAGVNVSVAIGNGRFSGVDQWPVLGVHRGHDVNQCAFKQSARNRPLNDSIMALSVGLPRRLKSRMTPLVYAQRSIAALTNSVPLSQ